MAEGKGTMRYWEALEYAKKIGSEGFVPDPEATERALAAVASKLEALKVEFGCFYSWLHGERLSDDDEDEWADGYQDARADVAQILKEAHALFGWKDAKKDPPPEDVAAVYLALAQGWAMPGTAAFNGFSWRNGFGDSLDVLFWREIPKAPRRTWYCPTCEKEVPAGEVTFEETHDERHGGCGGRVE